MTSPRDPRQVGERPLFSNTLDGTNNMPMLTLRELKMIEIMEAITEKPDWENKVFDDKITSKWRAEAMDLQPDEVTENMMDWVIKELQFKAKMYKEAGLVYVFDADVVKSDVKIPKSLQESLKTAVARLENVPEDAKDYHPGSDDQVLDLVHPSLFPLVYGRSRVIRNGCLTIEEGIKQSGRGEVLEWPGWEKQGTRRSNQNAWSKKFQWLPCDVSFAPVEQGAESGPVSFGTKDFRCKIRSYINNLHPDDHHDLYSVLEEIITRTIPLWNMTLSGARAFLPPKRINYHRATYHLDREKMPSQMEDEDDDDFWDRENQWEIDNRQVILPEPGEFMPRPISSAYQFVNDCEENVDKLKQGDDIDLHKDFKDSGLQVIVKLANIHLSPEKPNYPGGTWHVEGQLNERICASALYYYDCENITDSRLAFRASLFENSDAEVGYPQDHHDWLEKVFGLENHGPMVQELGSVSCKEGRLLTFPNTLQHRVQPFQLKDPTKPGHRKIVALFLVDPNVRITSTAEVPAQRSDWWRRLICLDRVLSRLPQELKDQVREDLGGFPFNMEEAKSLRLELMDERKEFVLYQDEKMHDYTFSLCEH
ncbi:hypothetical protein DIZ76_010687 [Coccidioides immitis]|nr:hypothetical protein DIZ76_010687 [Coccidioides immitis]